MPIMAFVLRVDLPVLNSPVLCKTIPRYQDVYIMSRDFPFSKNAWLILLAFLHCVP